MLISRQDAIDALKICDSNYDGINCHKCPLRDEQWDGAWQDDETDCYTKLMRDSAKILETPSALPEKPFTKADYIMALHKEYGCSLTRAEEAHNKALEYLQDEMMMKGGKNDTGII